MTNKTKHLHILGICGTFMGGIAALAKELGYRVTGCDAQVYPPMSTQLEQLGIELKQGYKTQHFDDEPDEEDKIPTYFKSLNEEFELIINALDGRYDHSEKDQYRFYTIANKLIREYSSDQLEATLHADEITLSVRELDQLRGSVRSAYENLKIATFTLEANPTVGYIQQNKLFTFLNEECHFEGWVLPHPKAPDLYDTLLKICYKLHEFGVYIPTENYTLEYICLIARKWIHGDSLKDIISEQIEWDVVNARKQSKNPSSVNTSVRNVIKVINNDIRFRLSNAFRCYQVLLSSILINKDIDLPNVKMHSFIEIGACDDRMINLINMGLTREAAKEIHDKLSFKVIIDSSKDLVSLQNAGKLETIHAVTKKEIIELFN